ncbi:YchJ family metal-binding protein [Colwellia sp. KU-HH00111]|uniref:YchJ family protein n=1 Tax=Colwellia sp. KU-HH00111 TaxID=3127652 RepID=UPI00336534F7
MLVNQQCFCGSGKRFLACCQPFIAQSAQPNTAEQLMRSRFSAYAIGNSQYIYDTYANSSQAAQSVSEIEQWGKACIWLALEIHETHGNTSDNDISAEQFVEFSAYYISDNTLCELRENSRFILEPARVDDHNQVQQWRYIDGEISQHCELSTVKRKDLCPCNYYPTAWSAKKGKKFKQCCGQ